MHIASFINVDTWNKAGWSGTLFAVTPKNANPPAIGFLFRDETAGRKIFTNWITRIGREDESDLIRVSIIEGDIPGHDAGYSVYVGTDAENYIAYVKEQDIDLSQSLLGLIGRFHRMHPKPDSPFLSAFKSSYAAVGHYLLIPAFGSPTQPAPAFDLAVRKKQIQFLQADGLGKDDVERVVLMKSN